MFALVIKCVLTGSICFLLVWWRPWPRVSWGRKGITVHHWGGKPSQEPVPGNCKEELKQSQRRNVLIGLLSFFFFFLKATETTCPHWAESSHIWNQENAPKEFPTGQSDGNIFLIKVPSIQITLVCHKASIRPYMWKKRSVQTPTLHKLCLLAFSVPREKRKGIRTLAYLPSWKLAFELSIFIYSFTN